VSEPTRGTEAGFGAAWSASLRRGSEAELDTWLALAHAACDEADALARAAFRRDLEITTKPDRTLVTQADTAIERAIRARIQAVHPDHGLVGEEYGTEAAGATTRWYIDPIDGTHNFIRGVPLFGTLLAVERDGELQAAVLSAPALRERWWARRGGGAWARGADDDAPRAIRVSRVGAIGDAQVLYGSGHDIEASGLAPGFRALLGEVWRERGFGDFWGYALLAEGAAEAMVEVDLSAWDAAAPAVLIEEAGGRVTDFDGRRAIDTGSFLATNGLLHDELLARLRRPGPNE
jgi:histidinol-phosphatase